MAGKCIFIDRDTTIHGAISTEELIVEGSVEGEVNATASVLIKSSAVVKGPIQTRKILIEEGAVHQGSIMLDDYNNIEADNKTKTEQTAIPAEGPAGTPENGKQPAGKVPVREN